MPIPFQTTLTIKFIAAMAVFSAVAQCSLVEVCRRFRCACYLHHGPDDGGSKHLWNVVKLLPDYTVQQPRRQQSSYLPPWEPKISFIVVHIRTDNPTVRQRNNGISSSFRSILRSRIAFWRSVCRSWYVIGTKIIAAMHKHVIKGSAQRDHMKRLSRIIWSSPYALMLWRSRWKLC
jgi:hypothetical protein